MAYKIKLSLHGSKPVVNRTVILDSHMDLYDASLVFITAMGWRGGRGHWFEIDDTRNKRRRVLERNAEERFSVDDLEWMNATFHYDRITDWMVDIEIKDLSDEPSPKVLTYRGECPNQILSGVNDFNRIRKAAEDLADPYHDQAVAWLATVPPYDMDAVNEQLRKGETALPEYYYKMRGPNEDAMMEYLDSARAMIGKGIIDETLRCPECGATCEGRRNLDLRPTRISNMMEYPATIACPKCGAVTDLYIKNDGFRIGYHENNSSQSQDQQAPLYDAISHKGDVRDPFEEARYQAGLGILYVRYEYNLDNSETVSRCRSALDKEDPRYSDTEALCRLSVVLQTLKKGEIPDDASGLSGALGADAMLHACCLKNETDEEVSIAIRKAIEMVESDSDANPIDRWMALGNIASASMHIRDVDGLMWSASALEDAASEADRNADSMVSKGWRNLCGLMEVVVCGLRLTGKLKEADRALKCMTGPFVDDMTDGTPIAVRDLVAFRRAMLFLTTGGDREQALEDLDTIMTTVKGYKDSGIFTIKRIAYVAMLRAHFGATKGKLLENERTLAINVLSQLCASGYADKDDMSYAIGDLARIYVKKGYPSNSLRKEFERFGVMIYDDLDGFGKFDIEEMWECRLTWVV